MLATYSLLSLSSYPAITGSPGKVRITNKGVTSITVEWNEVPCQQQNSEITQYIVEYSDGTSRGCTSTQTVDAPATSATITGLIAGTKYTIRVAARSSVGDGPFSDAVTAQSKYYSIHSYTAL